MIFTESKEILPLRGRKCEVLTFGSTATDRKYIDQMRNYETLWTQLNICMSFDILMKYGTRPIGQKTEHEILRDRPWIWLCIQAIYLASEMSQLLGRVMCSVIDCDVISKKQVQKRVDTRGLYFFQNLLGTSEDHQAWSIPAILVTYTKVTSMYEEIDYILSLLFGKDKVLLFLTGPVVNIAVNKIDI